MTENLHPEMDDSPFLDAKDHHRFRIMIGCANWLITLGRCDIAYAVNSLSKHNMVPRQRHLKAVIRIFGYLKKCWKARIIVDPNYPNHSMFPTPECDNWKELETSTYGSELVTGKQAIEFILEYRYMLRMMGVNLKKSALVLGDNNSVVLNTTMLRSILKKKHCTVSYNKIREEMAAGIVRLTHISSAQNYADILTKPLGPRVFMDLVKPLLFRNPTEE